MEEVIGARFKSVGKIYYFSCGGLNINVGDHLILETSRGVEYGKCVIGIKTIDENELSVPLKKCVRVATKNDMMINENNKLKEKEAFKIAKLKIKEFKLGMNLIDVDYTFDNTKIIFYFIAEGRVDFRELVKILANIFKARIELRQIGVRDEAKLVGGIGTCGRELCCSTFLGDFTSVSIRMAKEQNLSLNPSKISGMCGRLMCCLKYEQDAYEHIKGIIPNIGSIVKTSFGEGEVVGTSILREKIKVKFKFNDEEFLRDIGLEDVILKYSLDEDGAVGEQNKEKGKESSYLDYFINGE